MSVEGYIHLILAPRCMFASFAICYNKSNSTQNKKKPFKNSEEMDKVAWTIRCEIVWWLVGHFILGKCSGSPRYIFIAGSLATALPRLSYFMQSTLARKQENMGHPVIQASSSASRATHTHMLQFYECSSNSWTAESHCNAEISVTYFSHSVRHRNKRDAQQNKLRCDL